MKKYHIFLSCKDEILIENKNLNMFLKDLLTDGEDVDIKCITKHTNLELSKEDIDDLIDSSIYVVNTHEDLDYITSWELGYAMGKGLKLIGYSDGINEIKIPQDVKSLISPIPSDVTRFVEKINRTLEKLTPQKSPLGEIDWDKQSLVAKKDAEANL